MTGTRWYHTANDIVHDLAAGTGPGASVALWLAAARTRAALPPADSAEVMRAWSAVLLIPAAALAVLVVTGLVRLTYAGLGSPSRTRSRGVLLKHAVFVAVFVATVALAIAAL